MPDYAVTVKSTILLIKTVRDCQSKAEAIRKVRVGDCEAVEAICRAEDIRWSTATASVEW